MLKRFSGVEHLFSAEASGKRVGPVMTQSEAAAGINIKTAIAAHIRWRHRLESFVQGTSNENLLAHVVSADDQCILGQWIHGEARTRYGHFNLFSGLVVVHAQFHQHAGKVLAAARAGDIAQAMTLLQSGGYPKPGRLSFKLPGP